MAESLNAEQIAERRTNLRGFRVWLDMRDDSELTTTLLMQEEWLATVDELNAHVENVLKEAKGRYNLYDGESQRLAGVIKQLQGYARDAHTFRGLRARKCLLSDRMSGTRLDPSEVTSCPDFWDDENLYCAPCYIRVIHKPEDLPAESSAPVSESFTMLPLDVEEMWRAQYEAQPPTDITELELHSISLDSDPLEDAETARISLENVKRQMGCEDSSQAHVWVKLGKVGFNDYGMSAMDWGDTKCLRCGIPGPVPDFDEDEFTDL